VQAYVFPLSQPGQLSSDGVSGDPIGQFKWVEKDCPCSTSYPLCKHANFKCVNLWTPTLECWVRIFSKCLKSIFACFSQRHKAWCICKEWHHLVALDNHKCFIARLFIVQLYILNLTMHSIIPWSAKANLLCITPVASDLLYISFFSPWLSTSFYDHDVYLHHLLSLVHHHQVDASLINLIECISPHGCHSITKTKLGLSLTPLSFSWSQPWRTHLYSPLVSSLSLFVRIAWFLWDLKSWVEKLDDWEQERAILVFEHLWISSSIWWSVRYSWRWSLLDGLEFPNELLSLWWGTGSLWRLR